MTKEDIYKVLKTLDDITTEENCKQILQECIATLTAINKGEVSKLLSLADEPKSKNKRSDNDLITESIAEKINKYKNM